MDFSDLDAVTWPYQLTKAYHRELYPALEPSNPHLAAHGKTVLITGVSGGAIAQAWAIAGAASIVITGRKFDVLNDVASEIKVGRDDLNVFAYPADLCSEDSVKGLWDHAKAAVGKIDVLINNAGAMNYEATGSIEPSIWWRDFEVNVKGAYLMCHYFLKQANDEGTIIGVSSGAAGSNLPNMSSYASSKLAQIKFMEIIHVEHVGIRVFTVFPGLLKTAMTAKDYLPFARDDPMLTGGMSLFLCTRRAEWMRGGVVSVNWDIDELEAHKEEIMREGRNKLSFLNAKMGKGGHPWEKGE
ncbi:NAD(P)-binding protein [Astrocystis sublimbata]|nr:NAD(P)-binding protein [Astrocystis sublimbata]